jgi:hypothetical protein
MARIALKWIVVALVAASLLLVAAIALARLRPALPTTITLTQVPVDNIAVPLDAAGAGMQVLEDVSLSLKLAPYPPRAGVESSLTIVAIDRATQAIRPITPTLEVAALDAVSGESFEMQADVSGAHSATDQFFPAAGEWRMRVLVDFGAAEPHSVLILANAR